jgi:hypothetical protein
VRVHVTTEAKAQEHGGSAPASALTPRLNLHMQICFSICSAYTMLYRLLRALSCPFLHCSELLPGKVPSTYYLEVLVWGLGSMKLQLLPS